MPLFNHFDFLAPIYDAVIRSGASPQLLKLLDLQPGLLVLDAAGGTGRIARWIAPAIERQDLHSESHFNRSAVRGVIVVDLSLPMLRRMVQRPNLAGICASAVRLPYADALFDRILMVDALHHVADQAQAVRELVRVLKPGGRLVIEEPDIQARPVKWIALAEKLAGMGSRFLTLSEGTTLFAGLPGNLYHHQADHTIWWWFEKH